jgi:hypothetical protein
MPLVYLIDERISNPRSILDSLPKQDLGFLIGSWTSVPEIVHTVMNGLTGKTPASTKSSSGSSSTKSKAIEGRMITALRIYAHGDAEHIQLGWGIDERNAVQLKPLASQMLGGAGSDCLLLGCNVAISTHRAERFLGGAAVGQRFGSPCAGWSYGDVRIRDWPGFRLLYALARTLAVRVTAGLDTQTLSYDGHFLGATMTVDPIGHATFTGVDTPALAPHPLLDIDYRGTL